MERSVLFFYRLLSSSHSLLDAIDKQKCSTIGKRSTQSAKYTGTYSQSTLAKKVKQEGCAMHFIFNLFQFLPFLQWLFSVASWSSQAAQFSIHCLLVAATAAMLQPLAPTFDPPWVIGQLLSFCIVCGQYLFYNKTVNVLVL